jgi:hypothetical protein
MNCLRRQAAGVVTGVEGQVILRRVACLSVKGSDEVIK